MPARSRPCSRRSPCSRSAPIWSAPTGWARRSGLIRLIREAGWDRPLFLHGALQALCDLYRDHGIDLGALELAAGRDKAALAGEIVLAPPGALTDRWSRRLPDPVTAMASGWMRVRQRARQRGVELPLIISDHADWDELTATLEDVGAPEVWVTHGREEALVHWAARTRHPRPRPLPDRSGGRG